MTEVLREVCARVVGDSFEDTVVLKMSLEARKESDK